MAPTDYVWNSTDYVWNIHGLHVIDVNQWQCYKLAGGKIYDYIGKIFKNLLLKNHWTRKAEIDMPGSFLI